MPDFPFADLNIWRGCKRVLCNKEQRIRHKKNSAMQPMKKSMVMLRIVSDLALPIVNNVCTTQDLRLAGLWGFGLR